MPIVRVEMLEGRSVETKQRVAAEITEVIARLTSSDPKHIYVMFSDVARSDWGVAGLLFSDPEAKHEKPS